MRKHPVEASLIDTSDIFEALREISGSEQTQVTEEFMKY